MRVPSFSIQPLVENAVKYSVDGQPDVAEVEIEVSADGEDLVIRVLDNGVGLTGGSLDGSLGMALDNVRKRLRGLYGEKADLHLAERDEGGVEACLRIPALTS